MADQHIPTGFARVTLGYTRSGDPEEMLNVYGSELDTDGPTTAQTWADNHDVALGGQIASTITLTTVTVEVGSGSGAPPYLTFQINPNEGGGASAYELDPPNTAILIKKATATPGRQGRGRIYWPVAGSSFSNNVGILDSAVLSDLQDAFDLFLTNLATNGAAMHVLHQASGPITTPSEVTALIVDPKVATQRRRLRP